MSKSYNTVYLECKSKLWEAYFSLPEHDFVPKLVISDTKILNSIEVLDIECIERSLICNLEYEVDYEFTTNEGDILHELLTNPILDRMYFRMSLNYYVPKDFADALTRGYSKIWFYLIKTRKLEALVLNEMAHLPYSFIGYLIFKRLNYKVVFSSTFSFLGRSYFLNSYKDYEFFKRFGNRDYFFCENPTNESKLAHEEFIKILHSSPKSRRTRFVFLKQQFVSLRNILFPGFATRSKFRWVIDGQLLYPSTRYFYLIAFQKTLKRKSMETFYLRNSVMRVKDSNKIKVLFALHYEPELAVYPMAGNNFDQLELIKKLSSKLGEFGELYVKEHPWVFEPTKIKGIIRQKIDYSAIKDLGNTTLLDFRVSSSSILDQFDCVVTLTGTIGWEGFLLGIPVIHFGYAWYGGLPGTTLFEENLDILEFINISKTDLRRVDFNKIRTCFSNGLEDVYIRAKYGDESMYTEKAIVLKNSLEKRMENCCEQD